MKKIYFMEKINVAELLKDCPKGMELDCTIYDDVSLVEVNENLSFPIHVKINVEGGWTKEMTLTSKGKLGNHPNAKCVIFPKGKTTWEGFQRPFVDGDILSYQFPGFKNRTVYIYRHHPAMNTSYYVALSGDSGFMISYGKGCALHGNSDTTRLATEKEKAKLFRAIKDNGYKWNPETKTLEKLIELNFKVGNKIRNIKTDKIYKITKILSNYYVAKCHGSDITLSFNDQDEYELVSDKFDTNDLKPFDKVLVRDGNDDTWILEVTPTL